jgi:hypothetical protein
MHKQLNIMYEEFVKTHGLPLVNDMVIPFTNFVVDRYGIKLNLLLTTEPSGEPRYQVQEVFVVSEKKYTWFLLETA